MESASLNQQQNGFLTYLADCLCKPKANEVRQEVATIDGDIISDLALNAALKTGKGLMIGGFFVGSTLSNEAEFGYSLSI